MLQNSQDYTPNGQAAKPIVTAITYDAMRQRQSIWHGNGVKNTATYDSKTFRITCILSTRGTGEILQDHNYVYDAKGNIVEWTDEAQQSVFFNNTEVEAKNE